MGPGRRVEGESGEEERGRVKEGEAGRKRAQRDQTHSVRSRRGISLAATSVDAMRIKDELTRLNPSQVPAAQKREWSQRAMLSP